MTKLTTGRTSYKKRNMTDGTQYTLLNSKGISRDTFIYRIISIDRLYEMFRNRENVLIAPYKWEDPFENFILKSTVQSVSSGEMGKFGFHDDLYGQCWTLHKASDAMWRIYSPDKRAVRIRTTIDRLARSLSASLGEWAHAQCFIGKVDYLSEPTLKKFAKSIFANGLDAHGPARSLLVKRLAFRHENEVRFLYFEKEKKQHPEGLFRYQIDPHTLIDQLMIDPRLDLADVTTLQNQIRSSTGFQGEIKRSLLYAPPNGFIVRIP